LTGITDLSLLPSFMNLKKAVTAVGWLERGMDYPKGRVSDEFFAALVRLCVNPWQPAAALGRHECTLCQFTGGPATVRYRDRTVPIGSANVFLPTADGVYVSPNMIVHYVDAHEYQPPAIFQRAVMECPEMRSMAYLEQLRSHGFP
jgi:hypothetical protein